MRNLRKISETLSFCDQLRLADINKLVDMGFRSVICNRPDSEEINQPTFKQIQTALEAVNIDAYFLPVEPGEINDEHVKSFESALEELPTPTLAFCRTGMRSATLWAWSQADKQSAQDILSTAKAAGIDLNSIVNRDANGGG